MTIWAIVPVKPFRLGKSRLAGVISDEDRIKLNIRLLEHTLKTLALLPEIGQVLVVSRDANVLSISRELGAKTVLENGTPHLNTALMRATVYAQQHTIHGILILPADLPLISKSDILSLIKLAEKPPIVVISPDRRGEGTNALVISPPGLINYDFGPGSFERHCQRAILAGARLEIVKLPSLAFDLDVPEDLQLFDEINGIIR